MSKIKLKKYTITETINVQYEVIATSENEALEQYRVLPTEKFTEIVMEAASNNFCDDEVFDTEELTVEEALDFINDDKVPVTDKAITYIKKNLPEA
jgi:hypothetical protein